MASTTPFRYRLCSPHNMYVRHYLPMYRRLDVAVRALRALQADPTAPAEAVQDKILSGSVHGVSKEQYSINVLDGEAEFLYGRLMALHQVRGRAGGWAIPVTSKCLETVESSPSAALLSAEWQGAAAVREVLASACCYPAGVLLNQTCPLFCPSTHPT